ncbi:MAG: S24 family peptidase [Anaerohalosphaera sp.]|nr:S24 family peptidase [Anaerohalosphaera sp.]
MANNDEKLAFERLSALLTQQPQSLDAILAFFDLLEEKAQIENQLPPDSTPPAPKGWIPVLGRTAAGMAGFWQDSPLPPPDAAAVKLEHLVKKYVGKTITSSKPGFVATDVPPDSLPGNTNDTPANIINIMLDKDDYRTDQPVQFVDCPKIHDRFPDAFALHVDGDSMSPRINDTDIVIVSTSVPAVQGCPAVVCMKDQIGVSCKLIRSTETHVHLIPINERYEPKAYPSENIIWALAVLCHVRL